MAEFYTNLPPVSDDSLQDTIEKLKTTPYETEYQFNVCLLYTSPSPRDS